MANPVLTQKRFEAEADEGGIEAGWALPDELADPARRAQPPIVGDRKLMTTGGVFTATAVLLVILLGFGWVGWNQVEVTGTDATIPGWTFGVMIGALGVALVTIFVPKAARFTAPVYAGAMGVVVGAISKVYEVEFDGIVLQAVGLTVAVFGIMLFLYASRIIVVTRRLMMGIVAATAAVFLVYVVNIILSLFGSSVPYMHDTGPVGIIFSLVIVGIAAFNFLIDFYFVERAVAAGAPSYMEWYAAFGLTVTLIWLYLELLRLLSKIRS